MSLNSLNKVTLIGNLGKDPEIRHLENGVSVASFSIATSERYKAKDGSVVDKTEWHNIVAWRGLATLAEKYLNKGSKIYIEGKLTHRTYQDKDGNNQRTTEIVADDFVFLEKSSGGDNKPNDTSFPGSAAMHEGDTSSAFNEPADDDLPF